ncbi:MAG: hypothetical protein NTW17_02600 [Candidatus Pacearchaeota archaeon]|nr:hypothetical protein [Candidatus Pacearchaeota archaeon]
MAYEKFIKKDGKLYGPYLYESKRVDGKVISEYHGQKKFNLPKWVWIIPLVFLIVLGAYFIGQRGDKLTGHAILDLNANYQEGKSLEGGLQVSLKQGELIPASSVVVFENAGNKYEYPLSDLVSEQSTTGNFYVAGKTLDGSGKGFGISGTKEISPDVQFTLIISSEKNTEENTQAETNPGEETTSEETIPAETTPVETSSEPTSTEETTPAETTPEEIAPAEATTEESSSNPLSIIANFFLSLTPTGHAIVEVQNEVSGTVSAGNPFAYTLQEGEKAEIKPLSVMTGSNQLSENDVSLTTEGNIVTISTTYSEKEEGFGAGYSGDNVKELAIDLSKLNLLMEKGELKVNIIYNNENIVSLQTMLGSGEVVGESPVIPIEEPEINVPLNETTPINVSVNNSVLNISSVSELTTDEKNVLTNKFGSISVDTTEAKAKNGFIIVRYEIGNYWIENSYDSSLDSSLLSSFMESDRIKFLKDVAQKLSEQLESEKEIPELLGNKSY